MRIRIRALDTLYFRDGKPFSKGEDTWSDGIFPPNPSVIYGALRSCYFSQNIDEFREAQRNGQLNTENDPTNNLRITEIALIHSEQLTYPAPADCLIEEADKGEQGKRIRTYARKGISSYPCEYIIKTDRNNYKSSQGYLIKRDELDDYLSNSVDTLSLSRISSLVYNEPKTGISIDNNIGSARERMLYRIEMKRLTDIDIIVSFEGLALWEQGIMKLGGEGKAVSYNTFQNVQRIKIPEIRNEFVMYLSTPAIFESGWIPSFIDKSTMRGKIVPGLSVKLVSAIVNRPDNTGGWDMKKNRAKPMYKAVKSGSLYFLM